MSPFWDKIVLTSLGSAEMEHWHVPYNYARAEHVQAWLLKCLEGVIARDTDKEWDWMFKQRCVTESTIVLPTESGLTAHGFVQRSH
jgi:hypothetical protein